MTPKIRNWASLARLCLAGILCAAALLLSISAAQGRYRYRIPNTTDETDATEILLQAAKAEQICLWSEAGDEPEQLIPLTNWTETGIGRAVLKFRVSNGTLESYCSDPLRFGVGIAASLGIQNPDNVHIELKINEKTYTAQPIQIIEGSSRYETFGPGWMYCFFDRSGAEVTWELAEGGFSAVNAELTVEGTGEYVSLLQLEVTAFPEN